MNFTTVFENQSNLTLCAKKAANLSDVATYLQHMQWAFYAIKLEKIPLVVIKFTLKDYTKHKKSKH